MNIKILHVLLFWLLTFCHKNACLFCIIGIINYMRERSRRKPVDEEDTKLGRWVFFRIFEIHATVFWIYMYYGILFFGYTSTVFTASRLYYYICILHCALASLALLYHIIELCTRHWTLVRFGLFCFFRLHSFLTVKFVLLLHFADNLIRSKRESQRDFSLTLSTRLCERLQFSLA